MERRIVITGLGVISSIGIGRSAFWEALIRGESGISEITSFDTSCYPNHYGGEVKHFDSTRFISRRRAKQMGKASCLAVSAALLALEDAKVTLDAFDRDRAGVVMGTTMGESQVLEQLNEPWIKNGEAAIDPFLVGRYPCNVIPSHVAMAFKLRGPNYIIPTACAAGNYAIGYAYDILRNNKADLMFAGGVDAFSRLAFTGFNRLLAVAPRLCQPFDKERKGMLVGEGSGVLVLEALENALKRNAYIYAEVMGYGLSCDAHHMTAPHPDGMAQAFINALKEARLEPEEVDHINAHGTGTPSNDKAECLAINKVFGSCAKKPAVSSIKSMLGHTMGAASAIEASACCLSIANDLIPPTINFKTPDPECDIDCVPNVARRQKVTVALNNASAFGGNNACLVLKKFLPA